MNPDLYQIKVCAILDSKKKQNCVMIAVLFIRAYIVPIRTFRLML